MSHTIILAAGGTGGHIFPAEALSEELRARGHTVVLVTDKRFVGYAGAFNNVMVKTIAAGTLGKGITGRVRGGMNILFGIRQARKILRELKPAAIVGFGGYPSFPTMMASGKIPSFIHEQNAVLGRANRVLAGRVSKIATSYPITEGIQPQHASKIVFTGNPVRASIHVLSDIPYAECTVDGIMNILVMGGSQGASIFSEVLPQAIARLPTSLCARVRISQQCRAQDIDSTRNAYAAAQIHADLASFFTDVPARLATTHLVIARSGASTVAELTASGRPAILVPLPTAMDNHQMMNAMALEEAGGAWVMPQGGFTPETLAARLEAFLTLPTTLSKAATAARSMGRTDAAHKLADLVLESSMIR